VPKTAPGAGIKLAWYSIPERGNTSSALFHYFQFTIQKIFLRCLSGQMICGFIIKRIGMTREHARD
jgi:hypothetical protein